MKKLMLTLLLSVLVVGSVFTQDHSSYFRQEYDKRGFVSYSDWLFEFNSISNEIAECGKIIRGEKASNPFIGFDTYKSMFNNSCTKYKILLDIGIERKYIDDETRKQQIDKLAVEQDKVSKYLAQQSSGLGL